MVLEDEYFTAFSDVKSDTEENNLMKLKLNKMIDYLIKISQTTTKFEIPAFLRKQKILMKISNNYNEITPYITGSKTSSSDAQ